MNAKISVLVICIEGIIYLLLYNLTDCTFKDLHKTFWGTTKKCENKNLSQSEIHEVEKVTRFIILTYFQPMFHFYTLWKHQKTGGFLVFSRGIGVEYWLKIG